MTRRRSILIALASLTGAACAAVGLRLWYPHPSGANGPARGLPLGLEVVWSFEPPERGAIWSSPLVAGDRVYVGIIHDKGFLPVGAAYCLDRSTGKFCWKFDDEGAMEQMASSPCLADGRLYIGEGMHQNHRCKLYCLDAATSRKLWHFETTSHIESSPCVADGKVFFGAGDEGVYCLDAVNGSELWHFHGDYHVDASPCVVDGRLYIGSGQSRSQKLTEIFCFDAGTGARLWHHSSDLPVWGSPVVAGQDVFFGLGNGRLLEPPPPLVKPAGALLCCDRETGLERWRFTDCDMVFGKPAVDAQHVYLGSRDGWCCCLDRRDGRLYWRVSLGSPVWASPALCDGRLYLVSSGGRITCLDAGAGSVRWAFDLAAYTGTKPQMLSSPTVAAFEENGGIHHRIYFGAELMNSVNNAAVLYCLRED